MDEDGATDSQVEPSSPPQLEGTLAEQAEATPLIHSEHEPGDPGPIGTVPQMRTLTMDEVETTQHAAPTQSGDHEESGDD